MSKQDDFEIASRAFDVFTLAERQQALEAFARLQYPSVIDRFFEAVHSVIASKRQPETER